MRTLLIVALIVFLASPISLAQTSSPSSAVGSPSSTNQASATTTPSPSNTSPSVSSTGVTGGLATTSEITPDDLGVQEPTRLNFLRQRIRLFLAFNRRDRVERRLKLANLYLLAARQAVENGEVAEAERLLARYNRQITETQKRQATLTQSVTATDPTVQSLLDRIAEDRLKAASILDAMALKATGEFNRKTLKAREDALRHLLGILEKTDLTTEEGAAKIVKLAEQLAKKEAKAERKFLKRLALIEQLDEVTPEDDELEEAIDKALGDEEAKIAKLPIDQLESIASGLPRAVKKHLLVLEQVRARLTGQAAATIDEVIKKEEEKIARLLELGRTDPGLESLGEDADDGSVKEQIIARLKDRVKSDRAKDRLNDVEEKIAKHEAKQQERLSKLREKVKKVKEKEEEQDQVEKRATSRPTATQTPDTFGGLTTPKASESPEASETPKATASAKISPSPSPSASPPSTSSPNPESQKEFTVVILRSATSLGASAYDGAVTVTKGVKTKIKIRNDDLVSHTYTISNLGVQSGTVKPGDDKEVEFTPSQSGTFTVTCDFHPNSMSGKVTVN